MIYEYDCCDHIFEVIKPLAEFDRAEHCPKCAKPAKRIISRTSFQGASDWDTAAYCPALGQVVKSDKHRRQIARSRGLEEVGTQDMNKFNKAQDQERQKEADRRLDDAAADAYKHGFSA